MLETLIVFTIGLIPPVLSVWFMRQAETRAREQLRLAMERASMMPLRMPHQPPEVQYVEGVGELIGDITCQFNARSAYLRCAVNPDGPCQGCRYYQPRE
ncbi:DUF6464 family protein [Microseira sp. BLCC-F43]|jgi:hypothetical protein|uniref:DUF6464 family protein n=1 Tax=Microseira sp. BLCC-F43 TaxID=3153602 RepID=UPI0035B85402